MTDRMNVVRYRARVVLVACFASLTLPMMLNWFGIANYESQRSADDPYRPADRSVAERVCLVVEWMAPASFLVWVCAQFRIRKSLVFLRGKTGSRLLFAGIALLGVAFLVGTGLQWMSRPYSGEHFGAFDGWGFAAGWLLLCWWYVFRNRGQEGELNIF